MSYCGAMTELDPTDLADLYWAGRTVLVSRRDDIGVYDRVFRRFFLGDDAAAAELLQLSPAAASQVSQAALVLPATEPESDDRSEEAVGGLMASDVETLRHRSFAACTPDELAAVRRIMATTRLNPPRRRTRRTAPPRRGAAPDFARKARPSLRVHGEPAS